MMDPRLWPRSVATASARRRLTGSLAVLALGAGLCACGAIQGTPSVDPTAAMTLTQADNGRSVSMHVGQSLVVQLNSTYWVISGSSDRGVLAPEGAAQVAPSPGGCVPGQGCGTETGAFEAIRAGHSVVTASRNVCGEALACGAHQRRFSVTVQVVG
jgi:hypothetical protein